MKLIKRIIEWLIAFFKRLFGKKSKSNKTRVVKGKKDKDKKKNKNNINGNLETDLPDYMKIHDYDKEILLYSIALLKNFLTESNEKRKEIDEKKIVDTLQKKYNIKTKEIVDKKQLEDIVKELNETDKKEIIDTYANITKRDEEFKVHLKEIDKVISKINNSDISIVEEDEIDREISDVVNDKEIVNHIEEKIDYFNKNVCDIIDNVDEYFLKEVIREYEKVNYVTVSTTIIDKNYERFKKLEEDFKKHRFNKNYYEREVNKIKHQLNQIKNLKNKKEVSEHIEKLRKELYTKSKDKYDLLYNNEVFMNFDKECDLLLDKINVKVIDIKKEDKKKEEPKEDYRKKRYIDNILLRFQDMDLAREYILMTQQMDEELINQDEEEFINNIYRKYNNGINLDFNFERNKQKTELVVLFNELNMAISKKKEEPCITLDHINFRMDDLVEAVEVKKDVLNKLTNREDTLDIAKTSDKIKSLTFNPNDKSKTV
jgi:hypothetical protein